MTSIKQLSPEMAAGYDPVAVEAEWYQFWESNGLFKPASDTKTGDDKPKKNFTVMLPPPNVTGYLHLGHALTAAVQDSIIRYHRMRGDNTLYLPGTDHAGIATQVVVEKRLQKETGQSRHDLGREKFLERVWDFKNDHCGVIQKQLRLAGSSLDWSRERFTMDEGCGKSVTEAFVQLHEQGKLYRATRLVNWCCALQSAISDLEVEGEDFAPKTKTTVPGFDWPVIMGTLTHVAYKVVGMEGHELVFATTRPETMLGDSALAVHPDDERYKQYHGKTVMCPWRNEEIPIITDSTLVDMAFGTGVVKVTPAHDPNDYECGLRHNLPQIQVIDLKGYVIVDGKFKGMHRFECRKKIIDDLEPMGILRGIEGHTYRVGRCSRTNDIIEPMLMPQWFVDCQEMAAKSVEAVEKKELKLIPETHEATWFHFLRNVKPWCISRQLWWGHRVPAYLVRISGNLAGPNTEGSWVVARDEAEAKAKAIKQFNLTEEQQANMTLDQDPDVLDTWFSSGLWPFSTLGWPAGEAPDFKEFFPNSLLETGHDILFFWVARMVMMSLHFTGKLPFKEVYLHAMVRDKDGRKMSKTLGNVIDPLDVISGIKLEELHAKLKTGNLPEKELARAIKFQKEAFPDGIPQCGSDALRFGLLAYTQSGKSVNLDINRVVGYRQFCNKLWNVTRFALYHALGAEFKPSIEIKPELLASMPLECRWILSRLDLATKECNAGLSEGTYDFAAATTAAYRYWLYEVCDVFLELTKPVVNGKDEARKVLTQNVLLFVIEQGLRLLHPFMPFVTEELWHRIPGSPADQSIMMAAYPQVAEWRNLEVEADMKMVMDVVSSLRSSKAAYGLTGKTRPDVWLSSTDAAAFAVLSQQTLAISTLAVVGNTTAIMKEQEAEAVPAGCGIAVVNKNLAAHVLLKGNIDVAAELKKLEKKKGVLEKSLVGLQAKMANPTYTTKVPENVRAQNTEKEASIQKEVQQTVDAIAAMAALA